LNLTKAEKLEVYNMKGLSQPRMAKITISERIGGE
jgi:hypothetical protein